MCHAVRCKTCNKTTWAGCGNHIAAVKAGVPRGQWCDGKHTAAEIAAARANNPGLFARLFTR